MLIAEIVIPPSAQREATRDPIVYDHYFMFCQLKHL